MKKLISVLLTLCISFSTAYAYNFPEPDWGALLSERKAMENESYFDLYAEADISNSLYYGARLEPRAGAYIGTIPEHSAGFESLSSYLTYIQYEYGEYDLYFDARQKIAETKAIPMVGLNVSSMNADYDSIRKILDTLNAYNIPMFIRYANEMNCSNLGDNPDEYKQVFRNVANMIHEYPNFAVVWSPNDMGALDRPFDYFYPGDEYVDWIGTSLYMTKYFTNEKNTSLVNSQYFMTGDYAWATNKIKPLMEFLEKNNIKKPVMISEGGVARYNSHGDDYSGWHEPRLRNMLWYLVMKYPQIKMINYFNRPFYNSGEHYYISDYPESMNIFNEAAKSGAYIKPTNTTSEFVFRPANDAGTLVAKQGIIRLHTLAYFVQQPNISVNYTIDGVWYHSSDKIPYTCNLDINKFTDGAHTLTISANGSSKSYTMYKSGNCIRFGAQPDVNIVEQNKEITVTLNGNGIYFDQAPIMVNERVLVPIRAIFEAMGYTVMWNQDTQTANAQKGSEIITVQVGNDKVYYTTNGKSDVYTCDVLPQIISDRILVPVRAVAESAGCNVDWNAQQRQVVITK